MPHDHHHHHSAEQNIKLAFFLNFGFALIEAAGGFFTNSIAIMADALHDLGDSVTLFISWRLEKLSSRSGDQRYSYGYKRYSLLSAFIGSLILIGGAAVVIIESVKRIRNPQPLNAEGMLILSLLGITVNGIAAFRAGKGKNLNSRIIYLHLLEDVLGWAAVLVVSVVLMFFDIQILDPILSIAISLFVLVNVGKNLKQTINLFLQGVPTGIHIEQIEKAVLADDMVDGVHHTHIWSLDGENHVLTSHVVVCPDTKKEDIRRIKEIFRKLALDFHLAHTTIEFEYVEGDCSMNNDMETDNE